MDFQLDLLLDLPSITVEHSSEIEGHILLQLRCKYSGVAIDKTHELCAGRQNRVFTSDHGETIAVFSASNNSASVTSFKVSCNPSGTALNRAFRSNCSTMAGTS